VVHIASKVLKVLRNVSVPDGTDDDVDDDDNQYIKNIRISNEQ
jgi:hypothetical protein